MDPKICFFTLMIISLSVANQAEDRYKLLREVFYSEIGCKPLDDNKYECPDFKTTISRNKCYYGGKEYDAGERIEETRSFERTCKAGCSCRPPTGEDDFATVVCANVECPEALRPPLPLPGPNCRRIKEAGNCCASEAICGAELEALAKCNYGGRTYYEGEVIQPRGCHVCKCTKDFDNSTIAGNPNCQPLSCNIKQFNAKDLQNGCVPVYDWTPCCPSSYRCPAATDAVVSKGNLDEGVCKFGDLEIGIGGKINSTTDGEECRCVAPPMIECTVISRRWG